MQFITHRDPVNVGGWATALGATGDVVNNLLGIYGSYKNQQLEQKRYEREMAMKEEEARREAERQDVMTQMQARQLRLAELERGLPGKRPEVEETVKVGTRRIDDLVTAKTNEPAPLDLGAFTPDANKPDAARTNTPEPKPEQTAPLRGTIDMTMLRPAPVQYERQEAIRDRSGRVLAPEMSYAVEYEDEVRARKDKEALDRAVATGHMVRLSPEQRSQISDFIKSHPERAGLGVFAQTEYLPTATADAIIREIADDAKANKPALREFDGNLYEVDPKTGDMKLKMRGTDKQADAESRQLQRQENALRGEFNRESRKLREGLQQLDRFVGPAKSRIAEGKPPTPADEFALIYAFNKALDPQSVVRESEFKNSRTVGAGIVDRAFLLLENWRRGKQLTSTQITEMMDTIDRARQSSASALDEMSQEYRRLAVGYGIDPSRVLVLGTDEDKKKGKNEDPDADILSEGERALGAPAANASNPGGYPRPSPSASRTPPPSGVSGGSH